MDSILKRDRLIVIAALAAVTLLAWGYMVREARAMNLTGVGCCVGMTMSGPDTQPWSRATLLPLFLMWTEMMIAMMIPSAAPMVLTFALVQRKRREHQRPFVPRGIVLLGYFLVWAAFSAVAAIAQWILHAKALLSPMMVATSPAFGGALLILAGIFQWTPLKNACLAHCRSPLSFLMTDWRDGKSGALVMGLKYGVYCTGCCWILMALLFVAGVMNIGWIAAITVLVLAEKIAPKGRGIGEISGIAFIVWGTWMIATGI